MKKFFLCVLFCFSAALCSAAVDEDYAKADAALEARNFRAADFFITRILSADPGRDLKELLKKRALRPASLLSPEYDPAFVDWFVEASRSLWRVSEDKIKAKYQLYQVRYVSNKQYFVAVSTTPRLEQWSVSRPGAPVYLVSVGDPAARTTIISNYPTVLLDIGRHSLQYVWEPQLRDLDGDGVPEIFIRYNLSWSNGFRQILAVYKIKQDINLELIRKFEGQYEGVARLLENNQVEVASGFGSNASLSHMSYDKWRIEHWAYGPKGFEKKDEKVIPHPLKSKEWQKFV